MVPEALRTADVPRDPQVPVLREPVGLWGLPWAYSVTSESCRSRRGKATEGKALEGPADVFLTPAPPPPNHRLPGARESRVFIWGAGIAPPRRVYQESLVDNKGGGSLETVPACSSVK